MTTVARQSCSSYTLPTDPSHAWGVLDLVRDDANEGVGRMPGQVAPLKILTSSGYKVENSVGPRHPKMRQKARRAVTIDSRQQIRQSKSWYNPQVHQATGVIVAQTDVDPDEALNRLVGHAESTGLPVDAVAVAVIAREITFT